MSSKSFQKPFEDFVIFLFLESFYSEKCKFSSLKLNKEKSDLRNLCMMFAMLTVTRISGNYFCYKISAD